MHADSVEYRTSTIMPLAPISMPGYAATAIVTHRNGKREALGILGYFASESAACMFALNTQKPVSMDGDTRGRRFPFGKPAPAVCGAEVSDVRLLASALTRFRMQKKPQTLLRPETPTSRQER